MKKMKRIAVSLAMALTMLLTSVVGVSAAAPAIEEIEHKGNGRMEVEFYGKVKYKRAKVIVKDTSGKKYKVKAVRKDDDDIKFTIKNFKRGKTYKITVKGVKVRGTKKFGKRTGRITIGKGGSVANISRAKAIEIAMNHATTKLGATELFVQEAKFDDGKWEVELYGMVYGRYQDIDYEISRTGAILEFDVD